MVLYIYGLYASDDDTIMYIGKTSRPNTCLLNHLADAKIQSYPRSVWINAVIERGANLCMKIIEECSKDRAASRERHWIMHYRQIQPDLTNVTLPPLPPMIAVKLSSRKIYAKTISMTHLHAHTDQIIEKAQCQPIAVYSDSLPTVLILSPAEWARIEPEYERLVKKNHRLRLQMGKKG